jgi:hypothetical protein
MPPDNYSVSPLFVLAGKLSLFSLLPAAFSVFIEYTG